MSKFLPYVTRAEYQGDYRIHLTFNDGLSGVVDFRQWFGLPVFEPVKDPEYFRQFHLDAWTVGWPNGADIAPETLYEQVRDAAV